MIGSWRYNKTNAWFQINLLVPDHSPSAAGKHKKTLLVIMNSILPIFFLCINKYPCPASRKATVFLSKHFLKRIILISNRSDIFFINKYFHKCLTNQNIQQREPFKIPDN